VIPYNKTKIIATIGPASSSPEVLEQLIIAGVDVCRLNFSHGDYTEYERIVKDIRAINQKLGHHTAVLFDLQGPKLRIGDVTDNRVVLEKGKEVILTTNKCMGTAQRLYINYKQFPADATVDEVVLIDDGKIHLRVLETNYKDEVKAMVVVGGVVSSRKGINLPNTKISLPCLSEKDLQDLDFALRMNADWIGLSFVRSVQDIIELKKIISTDDNIARAKVIAKIEKPEALREIDHIIHETDALMVARGDLGVEMPMEEVPIIQKMLVRKCMQAAKPVIIATQMMESMIINPSPTRAEVNDIANSVFDAADAVMLSGETSVGAYPLRAVEYMRNVVHSVESTGFRYNRQHQPDVSSDSFISDSVCYNACVMASQVGAKAIAGFSRSGYTAFKVSSQRPRADIFIFTDRRALLSTLSLVWGVRGFLYERNSATTDETIVDIQDFLKENGYVKTDDIIINLASIPLAEKTKTNMIKLGKVR
jgi:pyruvate kinase